MGPRICAPSSLALWALVGLGCGGSDGTGPSDRQPVASVEITPSPANVAVGGTMQLTAVPRSSEGSVLTGRTITWASSSGGVVTVGATGQVTGVAVGRATITATSEDVEGTAEVTVSAAGAQLRTWVGGTSAIPGGADWSDGANWNPAGEPGELDTARVEPAATASVLTTDVRIARLILAGGTLRNAGRALTIERTVGAASVR